MFAYFFNSQVSPAGDQAEQALADTDYNLFPFPFFVSFCKKKSF